MTAVVLAIALMAQVVPADAGDPVLRRGIAAESTARWDDALVIYLDALTKSPGRADLWLRVADIQARLAQSADARAALEQAATMAPADAAIQHRLSQARAAAGEAVPALAAIERAIALSPHSIEYLRAHAALATWAGKYERAQDSYRRLAAALPAETTLALDLARVSAWAGSTDEAVRAYRDYLRAHPDEAPVWLELVTAESWRGNFPAAVEVLETYRRRFGESAEYSRELAATLARGGRPREATRLIDRLLPVSADTYQLNLSRTVALAAQQRRREALTTFEAVKRSQPERHETEGTERLLRAAVASTAEPRGTAYYDSDGLRVQRFAPRLSLAWLNGTRVDGGYERTDLRARQDSGLAQVGGTPTARQDHGWLGLTQRTGPLALSARGGYASIETADRFTYALGLQLDPSDTFRVSGSRESGFLAVSPRTIGLGLTRLAHGAELQWMPSLNYAIAIDASIEDLSDGNRRWDLLFAPRRIVARTQRLNLDLGARVRQFGAARDLSNGYYDPHRYESYAATAFPYWKIGENTGLAMSLALGIQRDDAWGGFRLGGDAAAEATFGIFERWMLKLNGAITLNERTETGAFRAYGGGIVLVRRF